MRDGWPKSSTNFDRAAHSRESGFAGGGPVVTVQSQKDEADINVLLKQFGIIGALPTNVRVPMYGDFEGVEDYQSACNAMIEAEKSFMKLPSDFRARLENDPQKFLEYCADVNNLPEMRKLGLAVPEAAPSVPSGSEAS